MEWKKYELEELMEKSGIVRGPFGGMLKKEIFVDKGYKVYEQKNAINSNYVDGRYYVTKEKYNELSRFKVRKNDFIVSCSGTIGKIYKIPEDAPQGIINQALLKLTINTKILDIDFFEQYFKWERFQDKITENSQGGAIKNLVGMKTFRKIELLIPSLKEQKKIAEILSSWDDKINGLIKLIDVQEIYREAVVKSLITKYHNQKLIKKEYKHLKHYLNNKNERVLDRNIEPVAVGINGIRLRSEIYDKELSDDYSNNKVIRQNDLCFGIGTNNILYDVLLEDKVYCVSPAYKVYEIDKIDAFYLKSYLDTFNEY